ncbi:MULTISPECIES: alpha-ketoglutarate-dependent dioxygenase AlkB family protein [Catenuloplanes]|uniref:Alkylated DNA repair dioxygenase AlkB n=1 Tax=Catenuloplanes niger TaxID=587534 RepID=A0AAE4CZG0_9ACTN|nr:alpha-ketoglutarate-dependent dioxygenase AlkB [Catenuloplanes niger]MDR7326849.1 alkylated DNA repair dioxygenase AlkB [Catenuloplanes niger]
MDLYVRYVPGALSDPDAVFGFLRTLEWDEGMRARQTASFGTPYDYSGRHHDPRPMPPELAAVAGTASVHAGHGFDNCLANRYETGANTMGFHRDSYAGPAPGSAVAIVSLGATRTLVFRGLDRQRRVEMPLAHGSLLLMTEETQRHWSHAVPRADGVGLRFSLTFRLSAS